MFKEESAKTKAKNQSRASRRGSTNPISSFVETKFENQSRACRGANRYTKIRIEIKSRACT
jgi:hypothetical protein